jgi:hypothetical protein
MSNFITPILVVVGAVFGGIVGILLLSFLLSWPVYMLWNGCLVDAVTVVKPIGWLQAWGITILTGFLFKTPVTTKSK